MKRWDWRCQRLRGRGRLVEVNRQCVQAGERNAPPGLPPEKTLLNEIVTAQQRAGQSHERDERGNHQVPSRTFARRAHPRLSLSAADAARDAFANGSSNNGDRRGLAPGLYSRRPIPIGPSSYQGYKRFVCIIRFWRRESQDWEDNIRKFKSVKQSRRNTMRMYSTKYMNDVI